jgi:hypothetical protein
METWNPAYQCFDPDADGLPKIFHDIPDTSVMDFHRGLTRLDDSQRGKVIKTATSYANQCIEGILVPSNRSWPTKPESLQDVEDLGSTHSELKDISIKLLKQLVGAMKSDHPGAKSMLGDCPVDPDLIKYADSLEPIKAVEMRKRLKCYLGDQFGLVAKNQGSGVWEYRSDGRRVVLEINYGGSWGQQLRYCILHPKAKRLTLEMLWGIGIGDWDYLHRDNFESSIAALGSIYSFFESLMEIKND